MSTIVGKTMKWFIRWLLQLFQEPEQFFVEYDDDNEMIITDNIF